MYRRRRVEEQVQRRDDGELVLTVQLPQAVLHQRLGIATGAAVALLVVAVH
jgi:hypothetical protein